MSAASVVAAGAVERFAVGKRVVGFVVLWIALNGQRFAI